MGRKRHTVGSVFRNKSDKSSRSSNTSSSSSSSSSSKSSIKPIPWIEQNIVCLECAKFVLARHSKSNSRCSCGLTFNEHPPNVQIESVTQQNLNLHPDISITGDYHLKPINERWHVKTHTQEIPTNAYGTVEFQGGPHPTKARYVRLHYETCPELILHLLLHEWRIRVPNLVISIVGGLANAPLQAKLQQVVQRGILRAAKTTGAWIVTNGLDIGVTRHIGEALKDEVHIRGSNIVALGIAPWGYVQHRETLIGLENTCSYYSQGWRPGRQEAPLNSDHNYFLLADNGTSGKFGGELGLRRRLEQYLAQQPIDMRRYGGSKSRVPIVGVLLEGGTQTFRTVFELVTGRNPVPIVVCDGSGRAADLLAFMHRYANEDGDLSAQLRDQMVANISRTFQIRRFEAEGLYSELKLCMKRRHLISVFRMGEGDSDEIDITILTALLQVSGQNLTPAEQLSLTMAWNRPDIARSKVFAKFNNWSKTTLENAMADALLNDRLEFVQLLLTKGLRIQRFLTRERLEELYNVDVNNQSFHKLFAKVLGTKQKITLRSIGQLIENLIGGGYQHSYCSKQSTTDLMGSPNHGNGWLPNVNVAFTNKHNSSVSEPVDSKTSRSNNLQNDGTTDKSIASCTLNPVSISNLLASKELVTQHLTNVINRQHATAQNVPYSTSFNDINQSNRYFRYPYTELLQWTLLTRRLNMAKFLVLAGEESIAKALFAVKLLRSIRHVTLDEETDIELLNECRSHELALERLAVDLQDHCYRHDQDQAKRLLTYELQAFSKNTCLSLAYMCESKVFIAHPCTQSILNDLWYGGLRKGDVVGGKVALILMGLIIPPLYPLIAFFFTKRSKFLEFKTKEELAQQPQTLQEHLDELDDSSDSSSSSSSSSTSSSSSCSNSRRSSACHPPLRDEKQLYANGNFLPTHNATADSILETIPTIEITPPAVSNKSNKIVTHSLISNNHVRSKLSNESNQENVNFHLINNNDNNRSLDHHQSHSNGNDKLDEIVKLSYCASSSQPCCNECINSINHKVNQKLNKKLHENYLMKNDGHTSELSSSIHHVNPDNLLYRSKEKNLVADIMNANLQNVHTVEKFPMEMNLAPRYHREPNSETAYPLAIKNHKSAQPMNLLQHIPKSLTQTPKNSYPGHNFDGLNHESRNHIRKQRYTLHPYTTTLNTSQNAALARHAFLLRSNLASLIPSNHYASVAASSGFQRRNFERRRNQAYGKTDQDPNIITQNTINGTRTSTVNFIADDSNLPTNPSALLHHHHIHKQHKSNPTLKDNSFSSLSYHRNGQWIPYDLPVGFDFHSPSNHGLQLSWRKKVYEFFSAPVTRFYLHVLLYLVFLILFIGLCIHTLPPDSFSYLELYVYLHILTYWLDKFREVTLNPGATYIQKFAVHMNAFWNIYDMIMCFVSIIGIILRYYGIVNPKYYMWGKNLLIICCSLWQMRFLELMQIWRFSGPYIYMLVKMVRLMIPMLTLLFLPLLAFGTIRQGIMYPTHTHVNLEAIKGIMLKPYFMLYGEVYAGEIDPVDWPVESQTAPFLEIVPIATVIYLLYSIILFVNVVIAVFNDIFASVRQQSELVYNYLRYAVIIEYESRPLLPPPFIIISWIYMSIRNIYRIRKQRKTSIQSNSSNLTNVTDVKKQTNHNTNNDNNSNNPNSSIKYDSRSHRDNEHHDTLMDPVTTELSAGLKLFLNPDEVEKLHDFEEECVEDYTRVTMKAEFHKAEGQVGILSKKIDQLQFRMDEIHVRQRHLRGLVHLVEEHLVCMEDNLHAFGAINPSPGTIHMHHNTNMEQLTPTTMVTTVNNHEMPSTPIVNNSREKDMIFTSTLLWLLKRQLSQDSGTAQNENIDYPTHLTRSLVSQLGRRSRVPTGSFSSRQHQNGLDSTFERSPSCSIRMKLRNSRMDHRHSLPVFDYISLPHSEGHYHGSHYDRMYDRGRNRFPANRVQHGSYRAPDFNYREYTTICDDIDLSCLSYPNSPIMSPNGSRMDLSSVGLIRNTHIPTDTTPIKGKESIPLTKFQNVQLVSTENIVNNSISQIISSTMAATTTTTKTSIEPKSAPATPGEERAILFQQPTTNISTQRSQSLATLHTYTMAVDKHSLIHGKHYPSYDMNSHFINPEHCPYAHLLTGDNDTITNPTDLQNMITNLQNYTQNINVADESYIINDYHDRNDYVDDDDSDDDVSADENNRRTVADDDNDAIGDGDMERDNDDDGMDDEDDQERKIQLGLQEAENAERIELQGAMLRRLRKLSTSIPCHLPGANTVTPTYLDKHNDAKTLKHGYNQINSQKPSCWNNEDLPDSIGEKSIISSNGHNHKSDLIISSEDMGDFLSHVAIEEEAVDPDLDLDFDSVMHESSSGGMRSSAESPIQMNTSTGINLVDDNIDLMDRNLLTSNEMNSNIDDDVLSPSLNSLTTTTTTEDTISNTANIHLSYPSPILEEKEDEVDDEYENKDHIHHHYHHEHTDKIDNDDDDDGNKVEEPTMVTTATSISSTTKKAMEIRKLP
ncbi:Transient receptor potential cation channel subfamily M member 7 isoform 2 [Schistosoma japonicum]|uniref:Transient receptor potential cation channel subfamily M member 7 isoform 2 n=1 Tax=Schistosoma japonicum TaxID=6182 RepID=A0A4Z2DUL3_SCHJA|nr:Transient receptor potential cation channel subfamily M member 7 isoform 2 [Schistosoma japonicum]